MMWGLDLPIDARLVALASRDAQHLVGVCWFLEERPLRLEHRPTSHLTVCRADDDRNVAEGRVATECLVEDHAVHHGHFQVEDDEAGWVMRAEIRQGFTPVRSGGRLEPREVQIGGKGLADVRFIVHNKCRAWLGRLDTLSNARENCCSRKSLADVAIHIGPR